MDFTVNRLSPVIGAEVVGADLAQPVDDDTFAALRRAWLDSDGVLVLRDQHLSPEQHIAFSRRFGARSGDVGQPLHHASPDQRLRRDRRALHAPHHGHGAGVR
jgi:taurine dioxygenase